MDDVADNKFPLKLNFLGVDLNKRQDPVCVVTIIGKSRHNVYRSKAGLLNDILDLDVFMGMLHNENCNWSQDMYELEGHYDSHSRVVYLHLQSVHDTSVLTHMVQTAAQHISHMGAHSFWQRAEFTFTRCLLYLFTLSHIVVLVHPGKTFDVGYVRLFRILDTIRVKMQPQVSEVLKGVGVSKDWVQAGRACSPRVLFVFEQCALQPGMAEREVSKNRTQKTLPIKRLQHAMEDQIYRILRKSRIITNISNNSLFAIPANQEFVFVCEENRESHDPVDQYLTQLKNNCSLLRDNGSARSHSYQTNRRTQQSSGQPEPSSTPPQTTECSSFEQNNFEDFMQQHIELAHSKGFDDNVGRNPVPAIFELPTLGVWLQLCEDLHTLFMSQPPDSRVRPHLNTLRSLLEVDTRFSEGRCAKVLPLAESAYQEGLPQHYTSSYHLNKVLQAKRVFCQHARGPACDKYLQQLEQDCQKVWQSGRQLCENISLTGNHCVHQLHRLSESESVTESTEHQPVLQHSSQIKTRATCNCGRKQADRDDPFDHKAANYDFYEKLELVCCKQLEHHTLPVFSPSGSEVKAGGGSVLPPAELKPAERVKKDSLKLDVVAGISNLSLALSLGQSAGSDTFGHGEQTSPNPDGSQSEPVPVVIPEESEHAELKPCRQPSTTEYLPGMIHSESPPGLLPKFNSWSLVCLGKYSSYSLTHGLDQPGFLHSGNHLLPWEMVVKGDREKWPSVNETSSGKKGKYKKAQKSDVTDLSLRLYVGLEYECPRGHRFFCIAPDKIYKVHNSATGKESASKVLNSDMPLYVPCHCRSSKGYMGQLIRLFVGVPAGPIQVQLNPCVIPAPPPCPAFSPTPDGSLTLGTAGLWVLRFPYIYLGEQGPYLMHSDPQHLAACRLLRGVITVNETAHG